MSDHDVRMGLSPKTRGIPILFGVLAMAMCGCSPQQKEARFLKRGQDLMSRKAYARAYLEFKNAVAAQPQDAEAYHQMGVAALSAGDIDNAARALRRATELNPNLTDAQLKVSQLLAATGDSNLAPEAIQRLNQVLVALPDNPDALDALALAEYRLGKPQDAIKNLQLALKKSPAHLASAIGLAELKLSVGDADGAEEALKTVVAAAPNSPDAAVALAQFYLSRQKMDQAETQARHALQLDPKNASALLLLATLQARSHRESEAEQTYQMISTLPDPRYRTVHAVFLFQQGKRDAALAELQQLRRKYPDDRAARTRLVAAYGAMNRLADAERELDTALKRNPSDQDALWQRGQLDLATGKIHQAENDLGQLVGLRSDSADAHFAMATVHRLKRDPQLEQQELTEALRLNSSFLAARLTLARSFLAAGQGESALHVLDEAPKPQKDLVSLLLERNWALLLSGDVSGAQRMVEAILKAQRLPDAVLQDAVIKMVNRDFAGAAQQAEEVLHASPSDVKAAYLLTDAYLAEKQLPRAVERVRQLVAQNPNSAPLQMLLGKLLASSNDLLQARAAFEGAKKAGSQSSEPDVALARLDVREKRVPEALRRLQAVVSRDGTNVPALMGLAELTGPSNPQGAIELYRSVVALDSSNFVALNDLAYWLAKSNPDQALPFAQKAVELAADNPDVQDTLGWIYYRKRLYQTALPYLKEAAKQSPTAEREFHLALTYLKTGNTAAGQPLLASALSKDPDLLKKESDWQDPVLPGRGSQRGDQGTPKNRPSGFTNARQ